jgi:hypothetical protein
MERPMTTFDSRNKAFEDRFMHDADLRFQAAARRNKLLGLWAAAIMGRSGADADAYATSVVVADLEEAGHEDVVRKLVADLAGTQTDEAMIRTAFVEMTAEARRQISAGV